jgi:hypothetical protein
MKLGFFFGAGAEIGYGLPSGGKFAIDLFRQDLSSHKEQFREQLKNINNLSLYATQWLPDSYTSARIHAFGKSEFTHLIQSSIEYRKKEILMRLNDFDSEVEKALKDIQIDKSYLEGKFKEHTQKTYGQFLYSQAIRLNEKLAKEVKLFGTEFYSALLTILSSSNGSHPNVDTTDLKRYASAFLQLLIGALGQDLIQKLNQELFEAAPDDIPIFDDVSGIFRLEFSRAGLNALELLLEEKRIYNTQTGNICDLLCAVSQQLIENIFTTVLDYQSLIDSHFRYLFSPKTEWAKFSKMVIFLRATRQYIVDQLENSRRTLPATSGYYHDLKKCNELGIEISAIGTSNYNSLIEEILEEEDCDTEKIFHLNGSTRDYYNPYKNSVIEYKNVNDVPTEQIHVPFILTQSGLKPLTSVDMSRRYVSLYDSYKDCDAIVTIGYGFNIDDNHINGLFRELIEKDKKPLYQVTVNRNTSITEQTKELSHKLRIEDKTNINIVLIDRETREKDSLLWLEYIKKIISSN